MEQTTPPQPFIHSLTWQCNFHHLPDVDHEIIPYGDLTFFGSSWWCKVWRPTAWGLPRWEGEAVWDIPEIQALWLVIVVTWKCVDGGFWGGLEILWDAAKWRFKIQKTPKAKPYLSVFTNLFGTYCIWILRFDRLLYMNRFGEIVAL